MSIFIVSALKTNPFGIQETFKPGIIFILSLSASSTSQQLWLPKMDTLQSHPESAVSRALYMMGKAEVALRQFLA